MLFIGCVFLCGGDQPDNLLIFFFARGEWGWWRGEAGNLDGGWEGRPRSVQDRSGSWTLRGADSWESRRFPAAVYDSTCVDRPVPLEERSTPGDAKPLKDTFHTIYMVVREVNPKDLKDLKDF